MRRARSRRATTDQGLRIGLFGILGSGNWGNDGSLDVVMSFLRSRFPDARFDAMVMGPAGLEARYGVPGVHLQWYEANMDRLSWVPSPLLKVVGRLLDPFRTLRWVRDIDVVVIPGAGVFETSVPTRPWALPASMLMVGLGARLTGARVAYVCVGADAPRKTLTHRVIVAAARLADYRSFRDEMSRDAMVTLGLDAADDPVYPDLAFGIEAPPVRGSTNRVVGVGVMRMVGGNDDRHRAEEIHRRYLDSVTRFVAWLLDEGWQVRLFTGDREDEPVLQEVLAAVRRSPDDAAVQGRKVGTLRELMDVMTELDVVVATRYHNVLSALKLSLPTISVGYAAKNDVLMDAMGLRSYHQSAKDLDVDLLIDQLRSLEAHRDAVVAGLEEVNRCNYAGVQHQLDDLEAFLRAGRPVTHGARRATTR